MATNTYVALAHTTVTVANASTIVFDSIPSTYTDLRVVVSGNAESGINNAYISFNNDTTLNTGSGTTLIGNGTTATSSRRANDSVIYMTVPLATSSTTKSIWTIDIMNYTSTNMFKTVLWRHSDAGNRTQAGVGLKQLTDAITRLDIACGTGVNKGNWAVGSTFSLYGIKAEVGESTPKATGGIVTSDATYWYHTFTTSGNFVPNQTLSCDYLVVAGGGGGNGGDIGNGGGGGAGGLLTGTSMSLTAGTKTILVGAGGSAGAGATPGSNSVLYGSSTITATGGGEGGTYLGGGGNGGCGGGAGQWGGSTVSGGAGSQGFKGGDSSGIGAGGGGGMGAAGQNCTGTTGGNGGIGIANSITGTAVYYSGGGGGSSHNNSTTQSTGGTGGGGAGGYRTAALVPVPPTAGTANTGGGGGGWGEYTSSRGGAPGGSGVVIIKYAK